ncbi:ectonucleotide pyrophosphatase/phosphodiesterase family member 1-like [Polypterus senegalus]|uniref:ectonucleotide pyrophosphatase/phosphodiesterase family member 1-like n=1 Tax=Polypterus senegalus TaxID=55291 RepID=UPI001962D680|nr:ectonucleotide pyrophosphatase/phosphodiesterase family member 1-like [Polypterus senegalus]
MENRKKEGMKAGAAAEDSAGIPLTGGENGQGESPRGRSNKSKGSKRIIIFTVLLLILIILIIGLVLGMRTCCKDEQYSCSKSRCGETSTPDSSFCSCADDCLDQGACCTNYNKVCRGKASWMEEECEDTEEPQCPPGFSQPPVILFSLDGFRSEYLERKTIKVPAIKKLKSCGVSPPYMIPVYPTKTFPNHFTIVTGLYPESHGIIDNRMYDPSRNASFSLKDKEKFVPSWYLGEPVWLTAKYNGLKSGTYFWPGSDVNISGSFPDKYMKFNKSKDFEERLYTILHWLALPKGERPDFYTLYLDEPDTSGHKYGPSSRQVEDALKRVDKIVEMLMDGLKQMKLHKCANVVLVSDHGMEESTCEKSVILSEFIPNTDDFVMRTGAAGRLMPTDLSVYSTYDYKNLMDNLTCKTSHQSFTPYMKENLPKRFHYAHSPRIGPLNFYMKAGWQAGLVKKDVYCSGGFHGSDNLFRNMRAIFIGYGPLFKFKTKVEPFENIEIYNLLCDLLNIAPAQNNGTHGTLNHLLKKPIFSPAFPMEVLGPYSCPFKAASVVHKMGCDCDNMNKTQEETLNQRLNLQSSEVAATNKSNMPYGRPRHLVSESYCLLYQRDYVTGYSTTYRTPLWSSYTIQPKDLSHRSSASSPQSSDCVRLDPRLSDGYHHGCAIYRRNLNITTGFLHPPDFSFAESRPDSLISSNMVPLYPDFKVIWLYLHNIFLPSYAKGKKGVNVISGQAFDNNFDGLVDSSEYMKSIPGIATPTHYFVIVSSCKTESELPETCEDSLDVVSFILPHRETYEEICTKSPDQRWIEDFLHLHVARVRDVELLTGLSFFHDRKWNMVEMLHLKTYLKTFPENEQ